MLKKAGFVQKCEVHGEFEPFVSCVGSKQYFSSCPFCFEDEKRKAIATDLAKIRERDAAAALNNACIPARYAQSSFSNFQADASITIGSGFRVVQEWARRVRDGKLTGMIALLGSVGVGKTHLACAALREICIAGGSGLYTTFGDLSRRVKATYADKPKESTEKAYQFFIKPHALVIDEIGVQSGRDSATPEDLKVIAEIIDKRYWEKRPAILISNLERAVFPEWVGERVISRLREADGAIIIMSGPDFRRKIAAEK